MYPVWGYFRVISDFPNDLTFTGTSALAFYCSVLGFNIVMTIATGNF